MGEKSKKSCSWCGIGTVREYQGRTHLQKEKIYCDVHCEDAANFLEAVFAVSFMLFSAVAFWLYLLYATLTFGFDIFGIVFVSFFALTSSAIFLFLVGEVPRVHRIRKNRPKNSRVEVVV